MSVKIVHHKKFLGMIKELMKDAQSVLDIGCGVGATLKDFPCPIKIGVDAHGPYLEKARLATSFLPIKCEAQRIGEIFLAKSVDCVSMIDVIEHMEKGVGYEVLAQAERIAVKRVIVFTPRGFFKQKAEDHYGLGGESFQEHRSGWEIEDFTQRGYQVIVFNQFHDQSNLAFVESYGKDAKPMDALLAWKELR